jgi:hypothetical protein
MSVAAWTTLARLELRAWAVAALDGIVPASHVVWASSDDPVLPSPWCVLSLESERMVSAEPALVKVPNTTIHAECYVHTMTLSAQVYSERNARGRTHADHAMAIAGELAARSMDNSIAPPYLTWLGYGVTRVDGPNDITGIVRGSRHATRADLLLDVYVVRHMLPAGDPIGTIQSASGSLSMQPGPVSATFGQPTPPPPEP